MGFIVHGFHSVKVTWPIFSSSLNGILPEQMVVPALSLIISLEAFVVEFWAAQVRDERMRMGIVWKLDVIHRRTPEVLMSAPDNSWKLVLKLEKDFRAVLSKRKEDNKSHFVLMNPG
ncbi:hypothetical protein DPV78_003517 [Talaromyces pinophilus]|nr:hypothetical protein DPV78_003517 [Talaromyces pinophilus]